MLHPRYSRLSSLVKTPLVRSTLPTGNGFGGSSLGIAPAWDFGFPVVSSSKLPSDSTRTIDIQQSSPLIIEVSKIILLAFWFWCSIAANFCFNTIGSLYTGNTQDI